MAITRWNPQWDPFQEIEEMMGRLPSTIGAGSMQKGFVPAVDIYEDKNNVIVETPLAGVAPEDVEVSVDGGVLTIQGVSRKEHEVEEKNYYRKEVRSGSFFRQVVLPTPVNEDKVAAEFADGVLKITCPKAVPSKAKKIAVAVKKLKK